MEVTQFEKIIFNIRGQKVIIDSDLARLYKVENKYLNKQVKRNFSRFPDDFMFQPNSAELESLRFQFGTANRSSDWNHMRRNPPMLFTEHGVAMLSSILNSEEAIQVNIAIMRFFSRHKKLQDFEGKILNQVEELKRSTTQVLGVVFERLDQIEEQLTPTIPGNRKKIGLKN